MTTSSIFNGHVRDNRYAILLWHDVETGRDTIARLDHNHFMALPVQLPGSGKASQTRTDDHNTFAALGHRHGVRLSGTGTFAITQQHGTEQLQEIACVHLSAFQHVKRVG